ncbi:hypothetical protein NHX12_029905, partial [Muraenolepis orangiensis]
MRSVSIGAGGAVKLRFESCLRGREVSFVSSDPGLSVRSDGSVYVEQEVANLSEPVQFMVTARGLRDPRIWETTVKLAVAGHAPSVGIEEMLSRVWDSQPRLIKFPRRHLRSSSSNGLRRQKRDWVIPPINVPENSRGPFPQMLVRIRSDQDLTVGIRYSITGAGADQPPSDIYSIDPVNGKMYVTRPLDREERASYHGIRSELASSPYPYIPTHHSRPPTSPHSQPAPTTSQPPQPASPHNQPPQPASPHSQPPTTISSQPAPTTSSSQPGF